MPPCLQVVQRVEDYGESTEPLDVELGVFDVRMVGDDLDCLVEFLGDFLRDL